MPKVHVQPACDAMGDEPSRLKISVPPAVNSLGAGSLLRVPPKLPPLLSFDPSPRIQPLGRIEEVVVGLRGTSDVGEVTCEEEAELNRDRASQRHQPLFLSFPKDADHAPGCVKVADPQPGKLGTPQPQL